ncbi:hypothetical protein [Methyloglobulus sp.]|uniref:hypothetical protein n=1 Tax=Methyloglobulus sp. TaxID=2518622 RepID=UPI0032B874AA
MILEGLWITTSWMQEQLPIRAKSFNFQISKGFQRVVIHQSEAHTFGGLRPA